MKIQKKDDSLKLSSKKTWKNYYDEEIKYLKESEILSVFDSLN